jgi:hypothetical protein
MTGGVTQCACRPWKNAEKVTHIPLHGSVTGFWLNAATFAIM